MISSPFFRSKSYSASRGKGRKGGSGQQQFRTAWLAVRFWRDVGHHAPGLMQQNIDMIHKTQMRVQSMRLNRIQAAIGIVSGIALLVIVLFPAWQEAAEKEVSYRKDIGHGLLWSPPKPVAVDCYFVGCVTAPASYFHMLLNRTLLLKQSLTLL